MNPPMLHTHDIAVLVSAVVNPGRTRKDLANSAAIALGDAHFERTVQMATIDRMVGAGFLQEAGSIDITMSGRAALKQSVEKMAAFLHVLNVTGALR